MRADWLAVVVGLTAVGCGGDEPPADTERAVRDSAGVEIVDSVLPPQPGPAYRLSPEPVVRLGAVQGSESEQFHRVRDAARLPDGRMAVLDAGNRNVRIFDPSGRHALSFGRQGEGPGEFSFPYQLEFLPPDILMVWDLQTWRTSWFDLEGNLLREDRGRTKYGPRIPAGWFGEGGAAVPGYGLLLHTHERGEAAEGPNGQVIRPPSVFLLFPRDSSAEAVELESGFPGGQQLFVQEGGHRRPVTIPFGKWSHYAVGGEPTRIWTGDNEAFELRAHDAEGRLVRLVRLQAQARPVTAVALREREQLLRESGKAVGLDPERVETDIRLAREAPLPERMPHYSGLHVAKDGSLWVEAYDHRPDAPVRFHVFDPSGRWSGTVEGPARFEPLEIGSDYVLGKTTDELAVEYVLLFDLLPA